MAIEVVVGELVKGICSLKLKGCTGQVPDLFKETVIHIVPQDAELGLDWAACEQCLNQQLESGEWVTKETSAS